MIKTTLSIIGIIGTQLVSQASAQTESRQDDLGSYAATVLEAPAILVAPQTLESPFWEAPFLEVPNLEVGGAGSKSQPEAYLTATSQADTKKLKFNVASYTGPLSDAGQLFAASKIDSEFRNKAVVTANLEREQGGALLPPWEHRIYTWSAPHFYHQPLYFQQINLERYGVGSRPLVSPIQSATHFYGSMALWPAKMIWNWPTESVYSLGHQRPGDCVNYQRCTWNE